MRSCFKRDHQPLLTPKICMDVTSSHHTTPPQNEKLFDFCQGKYSLQNNLQPHILAWNSSDLTIHFCIISSPFQLASSSETIWMTFFAPFGISTSYSRLTFFKFISSFLQNHHVVFTSNLENNHLDKVISPYNLTCWSLFIACEIKLNIDSWFFCVYTASCFPTFRRLPSSF